MVVIVVLVAVVVVVVVVVVVFVVVVLPVQLLSTIRCTADRSSVSIDYRP